MSACNFLLVLREQARSHWTTMARPLRIDMPDGAYHVTSRGLERRRIVRDDADRERWVDLLDRVATRRRWTVYAWALLDDHFYCRELTLSSTRALGVRSGGVTPQAICKTSRQVARRRGKERRLYRQLAKIEAKLRKQLQAET